MDIIDLSPRHQVDPGSPIELVILSVKNRAARCRLLRSDRIVTLRASGLWDVVPGEIVVVKPRKQWNYAGHPYLSREIESVRLDVPELDLVPLRLEKREIWDPDKEYWGEEGEPIGEWARPICVASTRMPISGTSTSTGGPRMRCVTARWARASGRGRPGEECMERGPGWKVKRRSAYWDRLRPVPLHPFPVQHLPLDRLRPHVAGPGRHLQGGPEGVNLPGIPERIAVRKP